jgi:hypothetical protein
VKRTSTKLFKITKVKHKGKDGKRVKEILEKMPWIEESSIETKSEISLEVTRIIETGRICEI